MTNFELQSVTDRYLEIVADNDMQLDALNIVLTNPKETLWQLTLIAADLHLQRQSQLAQTTPEHLFWEQHDVLNENYESAKIQLWTWPDSVIRQVISRLETELFPDGVPANSGEDEADV